MRCAVVLPPTATIPVPSDVTARTTVPPSSGCGRVESGKASLGWLHVVPSGETHDAGIHEGPDRTPPTAISEPVESRASPSTRWSPAPEKGSPAPLARCHRIPLGEDQTSPSVWVPSGAVPDASTTVGVTSRSVMTAPGRAPITLSAPATVTQSVPSVEYQTVWRPDTDPAAKAPWVPAATTSMAADPRAGEGFDGVGAAGEGSREASAVTATKGSPGPWDIHTAARSLSPRPTDPTMRVRAPHAVAAKARPSLPGSVVALHPTPSGEDHTVAAEDPSAAVRVPAISQSTPSRGAMTALRVEVAPPPMSRAAAALRCHPDGVTVTVGRDAPRAEEMLSAPAQPPIPMTAAVVTPTSRRRRRRGPGVDLSGRSGGTRRHLGGAGASRPSTRPARSAPPPPRGPPRARRR